MIAKFTRLEFELFTRPSKFDFIGVYQLLNSGIFERFYFLSCLYTLTIRQTKPMVSARLIKIIRLDAKKVIINVKGSF